MRQIMDTRNANGWTECIENEQRGVERWHHKWGPILAAERAGKPKPGEDTGPPPTAYSTRSQDPAWIKPPRPITPLPRPVSPLEKQVKLLEMKHELLMAIRDVENKIETCDKRVAAKR